MVRKGSSVRVRWRALWRRPWTWRGPDIRRRRRGSPARERCRARYGSRMISGDVIEAAGQRLASAARQPARVLLFGSHARGDAGADSDLDFLVIERDVPDRHAEMVRLGRE